MIVLSSWVCWTTTTTLLLSTTAVAAEVMEWTEREGYSVSAGRHHPITFANETHAFLLTGTTAQNLATNDMYVYSEADATWTDRSDEVSLLFPARSFGYGVVLSDRNSPYAYMGFGLNEKGQLLSDWWRFNMETYEWKELERLPSFGRRHPAVVPVRTSGSTSWKIHVGLGDGAAGNLNDWWTYNVDQDTWVEGPEFPSTRRHHPFYFGLGPYSYVGLGHSDPVTVLETLFGTPRIERDWYRFDDGDESWRQENDFTSYTTANGEVVVATTEARVAGTQFSIEGPALRDMDSTTSLGFVLSGDGDDHGFMSDGEFHAFYPETSSGDSSSSSYWVQLPSHPGPSRWAPGSFVMRGSTRAYFTSGIDRSSQTYHSDLWMIDLEPLFAEEESSETTTTTATSDPVSPTEEEEEDFPTTTSSFSDPEESPQTPGESEPDAETNDSPSWFSGADTCQFRIHCVCVLVATCSAMLSLVV